MEETNPTHEAIMECLTNLSALYHMADGWTDATIPFTAQINAFDKNILPQILKVQEEVKTLIKLLSQKVLRDDDEAIDMMFESIGKSVSSMCKMTLVQRNEYLERLYQI